MLPGPLKMDDLGYVTQNHLIYALMKFNKVYIYMHNEKLRDLYSSPSIIRIIKSQRMRLASHVARMGEKGEEERL
jgi:hypothetical protein